DVAEWHHGPDVGREFERGACLLDRVGELAERHNVAADSDPGSRSISAPGDARLPQRLRQPARGVAFAAGDDCDLIAAPIDQAADRGRQHLVDQARVGAPRDLGVGYLAMSRLARAYDRDGERRTGANAAQRADPLRLRIARRAAVHQIIDQNAIAAAVAG